MPKGISLSVCTLTGTALTVAVAAVSLLAAGDTRAADAQRGRLLYQNHCTVCHTSVVHVRERRKATSRAEIQSWIRRWQNELGLGWGATEVDDVAEFLDERYYRLKSEG